MRIVHISTRDTGGAGLAATRLHHGLRKLGQESTMFVSGGLCDDPSIINYGKTAGLSRLLHPIRLLRRVPQIMTDLDLVPYRQPQPKRFVLFTDDHSSYDIVSSLPSCDLINLHWVSRFVDYQRFFAILPKKVPIVWTLHDMNPFTGGCHYDDNCGRYMETCGECPRFGASRIFDRSADIWRRKKESYAAIPAGKLHLVAPSKWMSQRVRQSSLLRDIPVSVIPNPIDIEMFSPADKSYVRQSLGFDQKAIIVLCVAHSFRNPHKGIAELVDVLCGLNELPELVVVSAGRDKMPGSERLKKYIGLGPLNDGRALARLYSSADFLVVPSVQDNLPNSILESMSCGIPVVGYEVGGIPDMVRPNITGLLATAGKPLELRDAIFELATNSELRRNMSENCRKVILSEFAPEGIAERYLALYLEIAGVAG